MKREATEGFYIYETSQVLQEKWMKCSDGPQLMMIQVHRCFSISEPFSGVDVR